MQTVAAIAGILSVLISWIVGCKLIGIARRTRQSPELLIGLGLLMAGGLWAPLMAVGRQATGLSDAVRVALVMCGGISGFVGMTCIAIFTWRVYRPGETWAMTLSAGFAVFVALLYGAQTMNPGWLVFAQQEHGPWAMVSWVGTPLYTWSCLEAWRAHAMLSRRLRIGLADPVVCDRLKLWMWLQINSMVASTVFAILQSKGIPVAGTTFGLMLGALAAFVSTALLILAFMPPATYLDAVRRRALAES